MLRARALLAQLRLPECERRVIDCEFTLPPLEDARTAHEAHELDQPQQANDAHQLEHGEVRRRRLCVGVLVGVLERGEIEWEDRDDVENEPALQVVADDELRLINPPERVRRLCVDYGSTGGRSSTTRASRMRRGVGQQPGQPCEGGVPRRAPAVPWAALALLSRWRAVSHRGLHSPGTRAGS